MKVIGKKYYHKEGTLQQVNAYLKKLNLENFALDAEILPFIHQVGVDYYDYDGFIDYDNKCATISFEYHNSLYEVFVTKYQVVEEIVDASI